jgi:hypothetical protein
MGGSQNESKYDIWVCRDSDGLLHTVKIGRFFDAAGHLVRLQASAACRPRVQQLAVGSPNSYSGRSLPNMTLGNQWGKDRVTLVEYCVREAPTCVRCACSVLIDPEAIA